MTENDASQRTKGQRMARLRARYRIAVVGAACVAGKLGAAPARATAQPAALPAPAAARAGAAVQLSAPTNLRVTQLTRTSVTFQWDHSRGNQSGCVLPIVMYAVYVDGVFRGWTYLGSPVGFVARLRPGTTYRLAVQGRDNCTGATSPLSEPLRVTTLR
jgi:hypothetical protein